jgi:hypothetical protein
MAATVARPEASGGWPESEFDIIEIITKTWRTRPTTCFGLLRTGRRWRQGGVALTVDRGDADGGQRQC